MFLHLRSANAQHGGISIAQAFRHFLVLTKSIGLRQAVWAALRTFFQLLFREGGMFVRSRPKPFPYIVGAPRQWESLVANLVEESKQIDRNSVLPSALPAYVRELRELAYQSGNNPNFAEVTIVIPVFVNQAEVIALLGSIFSFCTRRNFKIVIADDCSPGVSFGSFSSIPGVTVQRNTSNLGYVKNLNASVAVTSTPFIITLNQDVVVCPGWLDSLIDHLENSPTCGVVGPRILNTEFVTQEAGGILHREARARHRGRGLHSDHPIVNYVTEVDYVSGCCIAMRSDLWRQLNGLNELLSPAYYDDVDLCMRARLRGYATHYVPMSCIIHREGTSMGTDEHDSTSLKRFQVVNRTKVATMYREQLSHHTEINEDVHFVSHFTSGLRVLCVFDTVPQPDRDGGSVDFLLIVDYLLELGCRVTASFSRDHSPALTSEWRRRGVQCASFEDPVGQHALDTSDMIFSFGTMTGIYLKEKIPKNKPWIHHTSDIATRRLLLMNKVDAESGIKSTEGSRWFAGLPRDVEAMWELEAPTVNNPTIALVVSEDDLAFCRDRRATGNLVHFQILKGAEDDWTVPPAPNTRNISFVGSMMHSPNPDAVDNFLETVWPIMQLKDPDTRFLIWGSGISDELRSRWGVFPGVEVRGWFAEWSEVINATRVFVSPLRFGAGMKHKVISSIILGRPVVGSDISFDGLDISSLSKGISVNDPNEVANSLLTILRDDAEWTAAWISSRKAVGTLFSRATELQRVRDIVEQAVGHAI